MRTLLILLCFFTGLPLMCQDPSCGYMIEVLNLDAAQDYHYEVSLDLGNNYFLSNNVKTHLVKSGNKGVLLGYYSSLCYPGHPDAYFEVTIVRSLKADSLLQKPPKEAMRFRGPMIPHTTFVTVQGFEPGLGISELYFPSDNSLRDFYKGYGRAAGEFMYSQRVIVNPIPSGVLFDDSIFNQTFTYFNGQLMAAVIYRDAGLLKPLLADEIKDGLMDVYSKDEFFKVHDRLWERLERILFLGFHQGYGSTVETLADENNFTAPSYLKHLNEEYAQGRNSLLALGQMVNVKSEADSLSETLTSLSYEMVEAVVDQELKNVQVKRQGIVWVKVKLANGRMGYINKDETSEKDFDTLVISKVEGQWKITTFHGDTRDW